MAIGDAIAQGIERRRGISDAFDWQRQCVMISWACIGDVPINLMLFGAVERVVNRLGIPPQASLGMSMCKALLFFTPGTLIRNPCFITYVTSFEHAVDNIAAHQWDVSHAMDDSAKCKDNITKKFREDLPVIIYNSTRLWVPVNTFTFFMLPVHLRVVWTSSINVLWLTYLSIVQHKEGEWEG